jgi:drug/metabolite transporter (DMT)-like permease
MLLKVLAFAALCLFWGVSWALIKVSWGAAPPLMAAGLRILLAGIVLAAAGALLKRHQRLRGRDWGLLTLTGLVSFTVCYGAVYIGEQRISAALAAVLFATFPAFTLFFSWAHGLERRPGVRRGAGMAVSFAGTVLLFADKVQLPDPEAYGYALLCLLSPAAGAWNLVVLKKHGQHLNALVLNCIPMLIGGAALVPLGLGFEKGPFLRADAKGWAALLFLAAFSTALAFFLYYWLLQHMRATTLSLVTYATTLVAALSGWWILREPLSATMALGALIIFCGLGLVMWEQNA